MASKRSTRRLAKLVLPAVLGVLLGGAACTRDAEADRRLDQFNSLLKGGHVVLKARLLRNDDLEQKATEFVDLSSKSDFILSLLLPARVIDNLSGPYPEICQIQVAENEETTPTLFHIYRLGKGPALYSVGGSSHRYARMMPSIPEQPQDRLDESLALCGFVQAAVAGDDAKQADYEKALRLSACLDQPK